MEVLDELFITTMATALPSGTPIASGDDSENTTSSTTMPPISTDDETGSADWFNKTCAVKSQGTHDHTGKMSAAFHAVMISADRLWDTKEVCYACPSIEHMLN